MALNNNEKEHVIYASILADGKIHVVAPEGTEGAVVREYETDDDKKNKTGVKSGRKTEMLYTELVGMITDIAFYEGNYGNQLQVTVQDGEDKPVILSLNTNQPYGKDMMKKLINVDMKKYVKIVPFSFPDEKTKKIKKGITIYQVDEKTEKSEKVKSYFFDEDKKKNLHGYPDLPVAITKLQESGKKVPSAKWVVYGTECSEFMIEFLTKHFKLDEKKKAEGEEDFDNLDDGKM